MRVDADGACAIVTRHAVSLLRPEHTTQVAYHAQDVVGSVTEKGAECKSFYGTHSRRARVAAGHCEQLRIGGYVLPWRAEKKHLLSPR